MAIKVEGEKYYDLDGQLLEIKRQLRQPNGYPYDPEKLRRHLQNAVEGKLEQVTLVLNSKSIPTKPFSPAPFLGENWAIWKGPVTGKGLSGGEEVDFRGSSLRELDVSRLRLKTCLKGGEEKITLKERLQRLKKWNNFYIRLGGNTFLGLWEDYQANSGDSSILEWLYQTYNITSMNFLGQLLRNPIGWCTALHLIRDSSIWNHYCFNLNDAYAAQFPSAVLEI